MYSEITKDYIKNGGFKITADDGTERIYGDYANAAGKAADGVVTRLHDYTGNDSIASGLSLIHISWGISISSSARQDVSTGCMSA